MTNKTKLPFPACPPLPSGVLGIKMGTNPNSSSIGTLLYALPVSLAAVGTIAGIVCAAKQDRKSEQTIEQEAPAKPPDEISDA
jgi:hypothetical protein